MSTTTHPQPITGGPKHVDRETTDGMLRHTRLTNEPREYLQKREELRLAEMEMFRNIERVAALRRALPTGAEVTDYVFQEGPRDLADSDSPISSVRLSQLFRLTPRRNELNPWSEMTISTSPSRSCSITRPTSASLC